MRDAYQPQIVVSRLPEGWSKTLVGDYLCLKNGNAFKSSLYVSPSKNTFPIIRISDLDGRKASDIKAVHVKEGVEGFELKKGDLLIAMSGATTGKVGVYDGKVPAYQNQRVGNLKLLSERNGCAGYRNYLISAISNQILKIAYGGAQPNISGKAIEELPIILPPLAEQKVIADKLDTLLAQVDNTKARLERIPQILKRFRQSVLAASVSGRLTEEWREQKCITPGRTIKLDEVIESSFYGPRFSKNEYTTAGPGVPTIRTTDMKNGIIKISSETPKVQVADEKLEQFKLSSGDLLITRTGSIGVMALFEGDYIAIPSAYLIRFRLKPSVNKRFIYYALTSPDAQQQMGLSSTAITQPNINAKSIRALIVTLHTPEEQTEIVRRVDQLFAHADRIEQQVNQALSRVNNLTQSILAKTFRGELTEQWRKDNPELISDENSAEALLERIKAERAAKAPVKRTRKKATV